MNLEYCPLCGHMLIEYTDFYIDTTMATGIMTLRECLWCGDFKQLGMEMEAIA